VDILTPHLGAVEVLICFNGVMLASQQKDEVYRRAWLLLALR